MAYEHIYFIHIVNLFYNIKDIQIHHFLTLKATFNALNELTIVLYLDRIIKKEVLIT